MSDWQPTPGAIEAVMTALGGSIVGSFIKRAGSRYAGLVSVVIGFSVSIIAGRAVVNATGLDPALVHGALGVCGVPLALRLRKFAETAEIGKLPPVEEDAS